MIIRVVLLVFFVNVGLFAQPTVESIPKLRKISQQLTDSVEYLYSHFCSINAKNTKNGDKVLFLASTYVTNRLLSHRMYVHGFGCMSKSQRYYVSGFLNVYLRKGDPFFFELVTAYELGDYIPFLEAHVPKDRNNIEERLMSAVHMTATHKVEFELSCMAALASFNDSIADVFIDIVNTTQKRIKAKYEHGEWGDVVLYYNLMETIMRIPKRRKIIVETLSLLDIGKVDMGHGEWSISSAYFRLIIEPLLARGINESRHLGENSKLGQDALEKVTKYIIDGVKWKDYVRE